jgi:hypothetical protein
VEEHASATAERKIPSGAQGAPSSRRHRPCHRRRKGKSESLAIGCFGALTAGARPPQPPPRGKEQGEKGKAEPPPPLRRAPAVTGGTPAAGDLVIQPPPGTGETETGVRGSKWLGLGFSRCTWRPYTDRQSR